MFRILLTGLITAMFVIQQSGCTDEGLLTRIRRQLPRYHYGNFLSRRLYPGNFTNLFLPEHSASSSGGGGGSNRGSGGGGRGGGGGGDSNRGGGGGGGGEGFFFQFDVPFWGRNIFGGDFQNGEWTFFFRLRKQLDPFHLFGIPKNSQVEDLEKSFDKMCCRFEERFLKDFPMLSNFPNHSNVNKIFLLDFSSQMSPAEWSHIQESLILMMDNMCLGTDNYEDTYQEADGQMVTLMTTDGQVKHYHKETLEVEKIKKDIVHMQGQKKISCTTTLLKKAYTYIDKYSDASKSSTKQEVLLITDGRSTCRSSSHVEAKRLRSVAHVSVVSITKNDSPQGKISMTDIASDSSTDNVYSFQSCKSFLDMMKHINRSPCRRCSRIEAN